MRRVAADSLVPLKGEVGARRLHHERRGALRRHDGVAAMPHDERAIVDLDRHRGRRVAEVAQIEESAA